MDSDRLSKLDENQLVSRIDGIVKEIEHIKTTQFIGSDSLKPKVLTTDSPDIFLADWSGAFYVINWSIDFIADHQANPYILAFLSIFDPQGNPISWSILNSYNFYQLTIVPGDGKMSQQIVADSNTPWAFRLFVQASDSGRLVIFNNQTQTQVQS